MIEIDGLRFSYRRVGEEFFGGLSFGFRAGHMTAVTGPSGSGKSTLLYILGLLLSTRHGDVLFSGECVSDLPEARKAYLRGREIGFVFQDAALDPRRSVLDNVIEGAIYAGIGRATARQRAQSLLERFGVELQIAHRPGEISGGQAQRIALCRALVKEPSIILADEPTGNLDSAASEVVLEALTDAAKMGATVVLCSHDPGIVRRADAVLSL